MHRDTFQHAPEAQPPFANSPASFLSVMDRTLPWSKLKALAQPSQSDCPPTRLERLLRIYLVQTWFGLSDLSAEAALHDSLSIRAFVGVDDNNIFMPNLGEIRDFRESLERGGARHGLKATVDQYLLANRYFLRAGSRIDPALGRYDEHTGYLGRLAEHFEGMSPPYELLEILRFNAIYRDIFRELNPAERQRAEQFVDRLIDGVASPAYVPRIFGVV